MPRREWAAMYRKAKAFHARRIFYFSYVRGPWEWLIFMFRHPRLWWFCRRMDLHYWFGLPMPLVEGRDFIRA